ncbi:MAG: NADH-quinone oxidoreductase subunit H [Campylobacter sp.]|nr:NADH-quinone oxidoreductase subunit H [Campylobacter sp.]
MILHLLLALALMPLFDGACRVMRAKIQSRQGPPLWQTYYDLLKLLRRRRTRPNSVHFVFRLTPYLCVAIGAMLVLFCSARSECLSDLIVIIYLLVAFRFIINLAALDSQNPFAAIGANRENMLALFAEPVMICGVIVVCIMFSTTNLAAIHSAVIGGEISAKISYVIAGVVFIWAMYIEMTRKPFDIAEAEQEVQEGVVAEFSGRDLALIEIGSMLKQFAVICLFVKIFIPFGFNNVLMDAIFTVILAEIFVTAAVMIDNFGPRYSMHSTLKLNASWMLGLGILSIILFAVGV